MDIILARFTPSPTKRLVNGLVPVKLAGGAADLLKLTPPWTFFVMRHIYLLPILVFKPQRMVHQLNHVPIRIVDVGIVATAVIPLAP